MIAGLQVHPSLTQDGRLAASRTGLVRPAARPEHRVGAIRFQRFAFGIWYQAITSGIGIGWRAMRRIGLGVEVLTVRLAEGVTNECVHFHGVEWGQTPSSVLGANG